MHVHARVESEPNPLASKVLRRVCELKGMPKTTRTARLNPVTSSPNRYFVKKQSTGRSAAIMWPSLEHLAGHVETPQANPKKTAGKITHATSTVELLQAVDCFMARSLFDRLTRCSYVNESRVDSDHWRSAVCGPSAGLKKMGNDPDAVWILA